MKKQTNASLKPYNSFGIEARAKEMIFVHDTIDLGTSLELIYAEKKPLLILGGGSNILFSKDYNGTIINILIKGIQVLEKTKNHIYIRVHAGEEWDNFVGFCVENNWGGLENLSYIPGNTGASPIQNIGAYGVELKDHFYCLEAMEISSGKIKQFDKEQCKFAYRSSVFKTQLKSKYVICSVIFKLNLKPEISQNYNAIKEYMSKNKITSPTIKDIRHAIIEIRKSKLPEPEKIGNAGSFFKNPVITHNDFEELKTKFPDIVAFNDKEGYMKIPAGWLIEKTGLKGFRKGDAGIYDKQALVIVNYGKASGNDIISLAKMVEKSVYEMFGIKLQPEVNII